MNLLIKFFKTAFFTTIVLTIINTICYAEIIEGGIRKEIVNSKNKEIKLPDVEPKYSTGAILAYNKGVEYFKLSEYDKSIASFKSAIKQERRFADAYFNLGVLYEYFDNIDGAILAFNRAYSINKKDYEALYHIIKCYILKEDKVAANFYFNKIDKESEFYQKSKELFN